MAFNVQAAHGTKNNKEDELDLVDKLLNDTGCAELHYKVQV